MKRFAQLFGILLLATALLAPLALSQRLAARPRPVRPLIFARDIQPILSQSCLACHGATQQMANLRLDSPEALAAGGVSGPVVVPGKSAESLLVRRLSGAADGPQMPMEGPKLTANQITLIQRWIDGGAAGLDVAAAPAPVKSSHWAYQPLHRPALPAVNNETWVRNPIDRFVLARLEKEGLKPSPEAPREMLIRRVSLDLVGLPPTLEDVRAFVSDTSPDAYQRVVDRLLSSPHYGERWARPWLDLARYADSQGYEKDNRRSIWLYRDWVIAAFNDDMPFDQFTIEQIAGDMLPNASAAQKIASGFHRNSMINEEGGIDPEEYRVAAVLDRVGTTASVFLGTTLACAQCHNHKYDPFTQEEFYRFYAYFNSAEPEIKVLDGGVREGMGPKMELPITPAMVAHRSRVEESMTAVEALLNRVDPALDASQAAWEQEMAAAVVPWTALDPVRTVSAGGARLTVLQDRSVLASGANPDRDTFIIVADTTLAGITGVRIEALTHPTLTRDGSSRGPRARFVMTGFEVEAASLADPAKAFHRLVVTSATYRQNSAVVPDLLERDPDNRLLARGPRRRLEAEMVRDNALAVAGLLSPRLGGPSVFPPQPEGIWNLYTGDKWRTSAGEDRYRRGLYTFWRRTAPYAMFTTFDAPTRELVCTRRTLTNTPLQSLTTLNDPSFFDAARGLALRVLALETSDSRARIVHGFELCTGRVPEVKEVDRLVGLFEQERTHFAQNLKAAAEIANGGDVRPREGIDLADFAAWTIVANVLLNLDETLTKG